MTISRLSKLLRLALSHLAISLFALTVARSQSSITITSPSMDAATAAASRTTYVAPVYPPIAKAAQVVGTVVLQIEIEADGSVGKVKVLSGPPMLNGAAVEAVKQWRYKPQSLDGAYAAVSTTVSVPFTLGKPAVKDEEIQRSFFPLSNQCHKAVAQNSSTEEQADLCRRAAEVADQFAPDTRYIERRSAYTYATTALLRNRQMKEAVKYSEKAVSVSEKADDDHSGRAAVYGVRAQAKAATGDLAGADLDLTRAEKEQRAGLDSPAGHALHAEYTHTLISLLRFHAQISEALGNSEAAQAELAEASKLQP